MKKIFIAISIICVFAVSAGAGTCPSGIGCDSGILNLPCEEVAVDHGPWLGGANSTLDITLGNVPDGFDVTDGTYTGWCLEDNLKPDLDATLPLVDSTCDEGDLPPTYQPIPWDKVNYLLNHKQGDKFDIQNALYYIAGTQSGATPPPNSVVQAMIDDANANGGGFEAGPGQVTAAVIYVDGIGKFGADPDDYQDTIIEVTVPKRCSIGDYVWEDANRNGCQDGDERPIEGVEVKLFENCDNPIEFKSTSTKADGSYEFTDLDCGKTYKVQFGDAGDIYAYTQADSCENGDPNVPKDEKDSDCSQTDGFSGCITFPDPVNNPNNPTIDCGYVCEGKIGDFVWLDENEDGCQEVDTEPGLDGITVNLFQVDVCEEPQGKPFKTDMTDSKGEYLFTGLCPGEYRVKFDDPAGRENTWANQNCPPDPPDNPEGGDTTDSDCGTDDECVTLTAGVPDGNSNIAQNLDTDCGKRPPPPDCNLEIDKQCRVETPPQVPFDKCEGKLQQFTVIWTGGSIVISGLPNDAPNGQVNTGQEVTFFGPFDSNDVIVDLDGATPDQSKFHVSCSDVNFNSPDDCGKSAGNGKSDDNNFNNGWILEGFIDKDGLVLDCNASNGDGDFSQNCEFEKQLVNCETFDKPTSLTFRYEGSGPVSGCTDNAASRANQKPPTCSGDLPAGATVMVTLNDGSADPMAVAPGEEFTITGFGSQTEVTLTGGGGEEVDDFHTSCSAPLELGDIFGNLVLVGWDGARGSADVTYRYVVTNKGDPLTGVVVNDSILGNIGTIASLVTNQSETLESTTVAISDTTTNTAVATGILPNGAQCPSNTDSVTVTAKEPTCDVAIAFEKLEDDKIKWKITNTSGIVATLETFVLNFPGSYGVIKKVKLDGDIYKADDSNLVVGPGVCPSPKMTGRSPTSASDSWIRAKPGTWKSNSRKRATGTVGLASILSGA